MSLIIVSGVSRGLGLALVADLLAAGYEVAACSQTNSDAIGNLQAAHGDRFSWFKADIGNPDEIERFVTEIQ